MSGKIILKQNRSSCDFRYILSISGINLSVVLRCQNRREGNDQESIQLSHTSHQRHQRERNTNTK